MIALYNISDPFFRFLILIDQLFINKWLINKKNAVSDKCNELALIYLMDEPDHPGVCVSYMPAYIFRNCNF